MMDYYFQFSINDVLKEFAYNNNVPFVDNCKIFSMLGGDYMKYREPIGYGFGGHPNDKGYRLIAENIYNKIIQEKIFELELTKNP